jgi:hypothetical protein
MTISRRSLLQISGASALFIPRHVSAQRTAERNADPLGVRADFSVTSERGLYLDSAYIGQTRKSSPTRVWPFSKPSAVVRSHCRRCRPRPIRFARSSPAGTRSPIVALGVRGDPAAARAIVQNAEIKMSFRENGTQIRVSPELFNTEGDVDRFLAVSERL